MHWMDGCMDERQTQLSSAGTKKNHNLILGYTMKITSSMHIDGLFNFIADMLFYRPMCRGISINSLTGTLKKLSELCVHITTESMLLLL